MRKLIRLHIYFAFFLLAFKLGQWVESFETERRVQYTLECLANFDNCKEKFSEHKTLLKTAKEYMR